MGPYGAKGGTSNVERTEKGFEKGVSKTEWGARFPKAWKWSNQEAPIRGKRKPILPLQGTNEKTLLEGGQPARVEEKREYSSAEKRKFGFNKGETPRVKPTDEQGSGLAAGPKRTRGATKAQEGLAGALGGKTLPRSHRLVWIEPPGEAGYFNKGRAQGGNSLSGGGRDLRAPAKDQQVQGGEVTNERT